jgi:ABC-type multidrug transport system fused ATPase/permease subunit
MFGAVWRYARAPERRTLILLYTCFIIANFALVAQPWVLGQVINALQQGGDHLITNTFKWLGGYSALMVVFWAVHGPSRVAEVVSAIKIKQNFNDTFYQMLTALPLQWHQDHHSGNTINRIRKAGDALYDFGSWQFIHIESTVRFFGPIAVLFYLDAGVAWILVGMSIFTFVMLAWADKKLIPLLHAENEQEHHYASALFDYLSNITTVITLRLERLTRTELQHRFAKIIPICHRRMIRNEIKWFSVFFVVTLSECLVVGGYIYLKVNAGAVIMVGTLVMVYQYVRQMSEAFFTMGDMYSRLVEQRIRLKAVEGITADYNQLAVKPQEVTGQDWQRAVVQNISFTYQDKDRQKNQLKDISLTLERGRRIALVGHSGAGKSTLLKVLRGLCISPSATLELDGQTYSNHFPLMGVSTLVPQEPEIFENTIAYNITVGLSHTPDDIDTAMKIACFDKVAAEFPKGVETNINEKGVNLSGGQKQRLALARGVFAAKESSLLLLDEPTSSVDALTEAEIYKNLFEAFPHMCVVSSIHRLHLLHLFDDIYFMDEGSVIEQGSLSQLLAQKGAFWSVWQKYQNTAVAS